MTLAVRDFATLTNEELIARGVAPSLATEMRERFAGTSRRISPKWARTLGSWGGVRTLEEIGHLVDASNLEVKSYARAIGLKYRTRNLHFTQAQLAVASFATVPVAAREIAGSLGLYPAEVCLYRVAMSAFLVAVSAPFGDVLAFSPDELERCWAAGGFDIGLAGGVEA